jgi:hypothetical protein
MELIHFVNGSKCYALELILRRAQDGSEHGALESGLSSLSRLSSFSGLFGLSGLSSLSGFGKVYPSDGRDSLYQWKLIRSYRICSEPPAGIGIVLLNFISGAKSYLLNIFKMLSVSCKKR